jgi:hypothetical protein
VLNKANPTGSSQDVAKWRTPFHPGLRPQMTSTQDTLYSSYREILLEHLFVSAIMKHLWLRGITQFEVLKPQVDDSGYDLVLEANGVVRHVQLKSSAADSSTAEVPVSIKLASKPSACVIWMHFDKSTMEIGPFLWYGSEPKVALPPIAALPVAKQARANAQGYKAPRPAHRVLRRKSFTKLQTIPELVDRLFGSFLIDSPLNDASAHVD